jgi:rubrerythrin
MGITKDEVVKAAAQLERDGRELYLDVAKKATNDLARTMFESLAHDELDHLHWVENLEPGVDTAEAANRELYDRLRPIFADVPEAKLRSFADSDDDVDAIGVAIGMEEKSIEAYDEWARECDDGPTRELCKTLVNIERFHRQVLNNTLEYFEHTPDWFMKEEQWNFEGGNV